jgi:hypothetical protein
MVDNTFFLWILASRHPGVNKIFYVCEGGSNMIKPRKRLLEGGEGQQAPTVDLFMPERVVIGPSEEVLVDLKIRLKFPPGVVGMLGLKRKAERDHRMRVSCNIIGTAG